MATHTKEADEMQMYQSGFVFTAKPMAAYPATLSNQDTQ